MANLSDALTELSAAAEAVRQRLATRLPALDVEVVESCASTNAELMHRARNGPLAPTLLVAVQQTAGRGRLGRAWHSEPGEALLFSLAVEGAGLHRSGLSLAVGMALADALDPAGERIGVKWPNDLWLRDDGAAAAGGRKLAGILIEAAAVRERRVLVLGVGLNVSGAIEAAAASGRFASGRATCREIDAEATPAAALDAVLPALVDTLRRFESHGFASFHGAYARRDVLRGQEVTSLGPQRLTGIAMGVDEAGALLLETAEAGLQRIISNEVSIRAAAADVERC